MNELFVSPCKSRLVSNLNFRICGLICQTSRGDFNQPRGTSIR